MTSSSRPSVSLSGATTALALGWSTGRLRSIAVVLIVVVSQTSGIANALWFRSLVDQAVAGHVHGAVVAAVGAAATMFVSFFGYVRGYDAVRLPLREDVGRDVDVSLMRVFSAGPGLAVQERADLADLGEMVRSNRSDLCDAFEDLVTWVALVAQLLAAVAVLASIEPRLAILILFALPSALAAGRADDLRGRAARAAAPHLRRCRRLENLTSNPASGREVRIFGLADMLVGRHRQAWQSAGDLIADGGKRATQLTTLAWAVFVVGYGLTILFVVQTAARGRASAGDVILTLALAAQFSSQVQGIIRNGHYLLLDLRVAGAYRQLVSFSPGASAAPSPGAQRAPEHLAEGVRLDSVSYRYPGAERWALDGVSVRLPAGSMVALVGENGAGKTTLVKVLTGLVSPERGRVLVDGVDLTLMDLADWRERIGASFQDFARLELTAGHAVGVGHLPLADDADQVAAVASSVGVRPLIDSLPAGFDTRLGRSWDGAELSGGQWQRLALARGSMRPTPLLLVLDEPTASLDPLGEHQVFTSYGELARREARRSGAITIFVTHRFAAAPMADLILVLQEGRLIEAGTHRHLLERGGHYAHLYRLQAQTYGADGG